MKSSIKITLCALLLGLSCCSEHKEIAMRDQCQNVGISYGPLYATAWYRNWCENDNYFVGIGYNMEE